MLDRCLVTGTLLDASGTPLSNARVRFTLTSRERDGANLIMRDPVRVTTDEAGQISVGLWPNSRGMAGTAYVVEISTRGGTVRHPSWMAVVPDTETADINDISELVPPSSVNDALAAVVEAREEANRAQGYADQTGLDRIATGEDRVATGADRVQTGLDRVATGEDRVATGADRVQTGQDRDATAAAAIATADDRVQTGQDRVATGLDAAQAAADRVATGQDRVATNQDAVATTADRVQTGEDRVAAANSEANALTYAGQADTSRQQSETARLGAENAETGAEQAYEDTLTALENVTDYSSTLGLLTGGAREIVAAADVVATFIYDTTRDSDGGAWRKRCRHTSWYNEPLNTATRGSRREFPSKALIVVRADTVTIYDLDTANCPMWMVFVGGSSRVFWRIPTNYPTDAAALNGVLAISLRDNGSSAGFCGIVDFVSDFGVANAGNATGYAAGPVANRNTLSPTITNYWIGSIIRSVNALAMAVLPGTPVDPVTKLPRPTLALATAAGTFVIHWDRRVTSSGNTSPMTSIGFTPDGTLWFRIGSTVVQSPPVQYTAGSFGISTYRPTSSFLSGFLHFPGGNPIVAPRAQAIGTDMGVSRFAERFVRRLGAVAYVTDTYNSGWQVGDVKMALAESTADLSNLVGSGELVTNGNFATNDLTGWTDISVGTGSADASSGGARLQGTDTSNRGWISQSFATTTGKLYSVTFEVTDDAGGIVSLGVASSGGSVGTLDFAVAATGVYTKSFIAPAATTHVSFRTTGVTDMTVDNVAVQLAATDRSVAANHPVIVGTVTRAAVASGAELAAHGGFSAANYLEVPITSLIGTGDFSLAFWISTADSGSTVDILTFLDASDALVLRIQKTTSSGTGSLVAAGFNPPGTSAAGISDPIGDIGVSGFEQVVLSRRSGIAEIWRNGSLSITNNNANWSLVNLAAATKLLVGNSTHATFAALRLALLRISATAPTPAQIREMYEAERHLFMPGAKCLLPGSNVSALAYDDSTELLHVATTAGSARLKGLLVTDKDASVYTGVDVRDGVIATRDSGSADIVLPAIPLREAAVAGLGHNGGPPLYDRSMVRTTGYTANATPTIIARLPMEKSEIGQWVIRTVAREYDGGAEMAAYEHVLLARRPGEGNIAISGSVTERVIQEVTSTMAVTIAANTTTQTIDVTATGVASKNIEWTVEARLA